MPSSMACPSGVMPMTQDCDGVCVPASYLGDKVCDTGVRGANLNCAQLQSDHGDCDAPLENNAKGAGGGIMKKMSDAHSGLSSKINSVAGRASTQALPSQLAAEVSDRSFVFSVGGLAAAGPDYCCDPAVLRGAQVQAAA